VTLSARPARELAIVTCMDCRLDVLGALGLQLGDAHVVRNAGGIVTDDVIRSLALSQHRLGTQEVMVIHHTGCAVEGLDVRDAVRQLRESPLLPHRDQIRGYIYDTDTHEVTEVGR